MTDAPKAMFYHMTRAPLEATLPQLLVRSLSAGRRVVVRGTDAGRLAWLDERLWLEPEEGFLPHGLAGGPHDADQPVLLTTGAGRPNGASCLMAVDGAEVAAEECEALDRVCIFFDGGDGAAVDRARAQWRALMATSLTLQYWSEDSGPWTLKTERRAGA